MKTSQQFVQELDAEVAKTVERIGAHSAGNAPAAGVGVSHLLVIALRNELEASEEAALWMTGERDVEVKLALARQCGDEAKHYRLIEDRLRGLGVDPATIDPLVRGYSPMFEFLRGLTTTVERVAAGPFAREALAQVRNDVFADWCEGQGDLDTARLYREVIGPDERHHHALGRRLLLRLATTPEAQEAARAAASKTLAIAQDLQEGALRAHGVARAPGC